MSEYFVPKLNLDQVYTASEYLIATGQRIPLASKESVIEADRMTALDERVKFAFLSTFSVDAAVHSGVVMVTTHNFCCCSSVGHNFVGVRIPHSEIVEIGKPTGFLSKKVSVCCELFSVEIGGPAQILTQLSESLKQASLVPKASPNTGCKTAAIIRRSAAQHNATAKIKASHRDERRLSKAETAAFGKCPNCNGTILAEKSGNVICCKCQKNLGPLK